MTKRNLLHLFALIVTLAVGVSAGYLSRDMTTPSITQDSQQPSFPLHTNSVTKHGENKSKNVGRQVENQIEADTILSSKDIIRILSQRINVKALDGSETREIRRQIEHNHELAFQLLNELNGLETEELRQIVRHILMMTNLTRKPLLEKHILNGLKSGEADLAWWGLLAEFGVQTRGGVDFFNDQLSFQSDPRKLQAAARALSKFGSSSAYQTPPLDRETRNLVLQSFNRLRGHHDEYVRAAAVESLHAFIPDDVELQIILALDDDSTAVRAKAFQVFVNKLGSSQKVMDRLMVNLTDHSRPLLERHNLARMLTTSSSPHLDLEVIAEIASDLKSELASFSAEERFDLNDSRRRQLEPEIK